MTTMTLSVSDVLSAYRADREMVVASPERLSSSIAPLDRHLGVLEAAAVSRPCVMTYLSARRAEGVGDQTVRRELITLRAALRMAWRDGLLAAVPSLPMPTPAPPRQRVLTLDEVQRLRQVAADDPALEMFLALLLATGARRGAVLELTWDRVDLVGRIIDFRAPHPREARRKHRAVVPFGAPLAKLLKRHRRRQPGDLVVGQSIYVIRRRWRAACARAELEGVTPHVIRHTVATHLLRHVSLVQASRMLGHKSVAITEQVYGHLTVGDLAPAAAALDFWLR